ncbi:hypothetical protein OPW39_15585 [Vibrio europaeus]|uniref:hypothetical protein n=1 Tax=Vibrio europaeus TaxID=300876 RepID=UPI00233F13B5|nr:hypothetical protein [Vibrio europaeus]MDC5870229.1 hypothetical protein [Vibrio europaeus]
MMQTVMCFKHDSWVATDVFKMESGDIFAHKNQTYVVTAKPYVLDGKPNVPAELYDSDPIVINFDKGQDYIHMAMDYVCSPAHNFGDGTMQICEFADGNTNVYSPRLPVAELNEFCKAHIDHYEAFFNKHERQLESGVAIEIPKFW